MQNIELLLEDAVAYRAAYSYLQSWEKETLNKSQFTNWILSPRRSGLYYLYKAASHPDTENKILASCIENMVCEAMNSSEIKELLHRAFQTYELMDELADYLNKALETGCNEGRPEYLVAAMILAPEHAWHPALHPTAI